MAEDRWTPNQNRALHLIESAMDGLFAALDRNDITVADLEVIGETEIAEWFQTWLDDGDEDPTEGKTMQEVARMVAERRRAAVELPPAVAETIERMHADPSSAVRSGRPQRRSGAG